MMTNAKIGIALLGGYLLGRTKKAKLAVALGMWLAGKRLPLDPGQLGKALADSPVFSGLNEQVRKELMEAVKAAASAAVTARADSLADSLHERTVNLQEGVTTVREKAEPKGRGEERGGAEPGVEEADVEEPGVEEADVEEPGVEEPGVEEADEEGEAEERRRPRVQPGVRKTTGAVHTTARSTVGHAKKSLSGERTKVGHGGSGAGRASRRATERRPSDG
jgi:hypothetical protein